MVSLPYTNLFIRPTHTIATAGSHILVLENSTGGVSSSHVLQEDAKSGPVRCADVDVTGKYVAVVGEDKMLTLWAMRDDSVLTMTNRRELPKRPTKLRFSKDGLRILVSDKFGDVFSYPLSYDPNSRDISQQNQKDTFSSHENPSNGTLVLGHASPLNGFVLTGDEKYIITADRDEHIRVSHYPKGYNIEMYCLGHSKFVSALHIVRYEPALLISGGGDAEIKVWDWMKGILKWELRVWDVVDRFLVIKTVRRSGWGEEDGEGKAGKKRRKRKGKGSERTDGGEAGGDDEGNDSSVDNDATKVLVIQQIESVASGSTVYILFSATGATALFAFPFKSGVQPSEIFHFDFRKPVLGFSIADSGRVIVYLDKEWTDPETEAMSEDNAKSVRVAHISLGQFTECTEYMKELIGSLNAKALILANATELSSLDLYGLLTTLPKKSSGQDVEEASLPIGAPELSASNYKAKRKAKAHEPEKKKEMSKKEMGRLKGKMKVSEKAKEQEQGREMSAKKHLARKGDSEEGENYADKGTKKVRVEEEI